MAAKYSENLTYKRVTTYRIEQIHKILDWRHEKRAFKIKITHFEFSFNFLNIFSLKNKTKIVSVVRFTGFIGSANIWAISDVTLRQTRCKYG